MHTVSVEHAKAHLDELLEEAVHGAAVAIAVGDDVVVRWTVERKSPAPEVAAGGWPFMGLYEGQGWMAPDFNEIPKRVMEPPLDAKVGWPFMGLYAGKMVLPEGWDADLPLEMWDALKS